VVANDDEDGWWQGQVMARAVRRQTSTQRNKGQKRQLWHSGLASHHTVERHTEKEGGNGPQLPPKACK